jgi:hypothetical protein
VKTKVTKPTLIKKGKEVFGDMSKFNIWLNTESVTLECKPMTMYEKEKLNKIYDELVKIDKIR